MKRHNSAGVDNLVLAAIEAAMGSAKRYSRALTLKHGIIVCEPGERLHGVYFPLTCVLSSISTLQNGTAVETASAGREGAFGLLTVLGSGHLSARCQVQVGGRAVYVPAEHMIELFHRSGPVRQIVMGYIETVMFQNLQSVACRTSHTTAARLCRWLLTMRERVGVDKLSFTHEFVAPALGANRTTISLVMADLRREGLVACARSRVTILDRDGLERKSCECFFNLKQRYARLSL